MNTLQINNVTKTYPNGVKALNGISLAINNGMFGLLGPNGAGKSSLMRTIAGLQTPDSGFITFNGNDIHQNPNAIRSHLGYLPQEFGVYPKVSAYKMLEHMAILKGISNAKDRREQILSLLEQTNLYNARKKSVSTYSGGMRQRFGIAQALLGDPKIIIVDEPTAGLDPEERNRFHNLLSEIGEHIIVILSTHIVEDVRDLCTNMAIVSTGEVVLTGKPLTLIDQLENRVWMKSIQKEELPAYQKAFSVISSRLFTGQMQIHIISDDDPMHGFVKLKPGLEDVYFSVLNNQFTINTPAHV